MRPHGASGFSLLEVLAALALLAILLLGVYSGVRMTTASVQRGSSMIDRLDLVRGAREFLRRELSEATALPYAMDQKRHPVVFSGTATRIRFVAPLPGYLGRRGAQLMTVRLEEDSRDGQRLVVEIAPLPAGVAPVPIAEPERLVDGLHGMRFRYAGADGMWKDEWTDRSSLPVLVELGEGDAMHDGTWPVLTVAPRETAGALNAAAIGRGLPTENLP